jgi:hypothetical protein
VEGELKVDRTKVKVPALALVPGKGVKVGVALAG